MNKRIDNSNDLKFNSVNLRDFRWRDQSLPRVVSPYTLSNCMTDHRIKNNPLSSFENKQRSFSNISYMVFFAYLTIYGVIITGLYQVTL
jgi:hypothetical protein